MINTFFLFIPILLTIITLDIISQESFPYNLIFKVNKYDNKKFINRNQIKKIEIFKYKCANNKNDSTLKPNCTDTILYKQYFYSSTGNIIEESEYSDIGKLIFRELFFYDNNDNNYMITNYSYYDGYFDTIYFSNIIYNNLNNKIKEQITKKIHYRGYEGNSAIHKYDLNYDYYSNHRLKSIMNIYSNDTAISLYDYYGNPISKYSNNCEIYYAYNHLPKKITVKSVSMLYNTDKRSVNVNIMGNTNGKVLLEHYRESNSNSLSDLLIQYQFDSLKNLISISYKDKVYRNSLDSNGTLHFSEENCVYNKFNKILEKTVCEPIIMKYQYLRCFIKKYKYFYDSDSILTGYTKTIYKDIIDIRTGKQIFNSSNKGISFRYDSKGNLVEENHIGIYTNDQGSWFLGTSETLFYENELLMSIIQFFDESEKNYKLYRYEFYEH